MVERPQLLGTLQYNSFPAKPYIHLTCLHYVECQMAVVSISLRHSVHRMKHLSCLGTLQYSLELEHMELERMDRYLTHTEKSCVMTV